MAWWLPVTRYWRSLNQRARWLCRYGDAEADKGIKTTPDARFFAISSALDEAFTNKDVPLVLQARAGWPRGVRWGGAAPEGDLVRNAPACPPAWRHLRVCDSSCARAAVVAAAQPAGSMPRTGRSHWAFPAQPLKASSLQRFSSQQQASRCSGSAVLFILFSHGLG